LTGNINLRNQNPLRSSFDYQPGPEVNSGWSSQVEQTTVNQRSFQPPPQDPYNQPPAFGNSQNTSFLSSIINLSSILSSVLSIGSAFNQAGSQQQQPQPDTSGYYDEENEPPLLEGKTKNI